MPLPALQYSLYPAPQRFESGTVSGEEKLKPICLIAIAGFLFAGCECFLPSGKAPEGGIVSNPGTAVTVLLLDRRAALDYFINELIRETMLHCAGGVIAVDADRDSAQAAEYIIARTAEFSGITRTAVPGKHPRLISRRLAGNQWQMELISPVGESLWKRTVSIK